MAHALPTYKFPYNIFYLIAIVSNAFALSLPSKLPTLAHLYLSHIYTFIISSDCALAVGTMPIPFNASVDVDNAIIVSITFV